VKRRHQQADTRPGFTIVEVLVALVILSIGVLALASTAALVARQMGTSARLSTAASLGQSRLERLASAASCSAVRGGAATTAGIEERWTVAVAGTVATVSDVVRMTPGAAPITFETAVRCE